MSDFSDRLREERKRLGLNQVDFANLGGVKKNAQLNYENGERKPDSDYLYALLKSGVDVIYMLTGERSATTLSKDESDLIVGYRSLDLRGKAGVLALIGGMNPVQSAPQNAFHGNVGQVVQSDITAPQTFNFGVKQTKK
ncbi:helix-turn-helix domain-containing protein [Undibacterium rugosum]|uniref:helix-turn-helix domain-containing protein n=1 Tax=Undibacterium rugosum TaxID=2762291 RepID=UPI001B8238BE|nr:helix-turn-helix transcriptional regulator [Undibacterium rugosum]MBR7777388.1 helix-turn-helix transcriptional regulator [Undibacterium rugosum]